MCFYLDYTKTKFRMQYFIRKFEGRSVSCTLTQINLFSANIQSFLVNLFSCCFCSASSISTVCYSAYFRKSRKSIFIFINGETVIVAIDSSFNLSNSITSSMMNTSVFHHRIVFFFCFYCIWIFKKVHLRASVFTNCFRALYGFSSAKCVYWFSNIFRNI